MPSRVWRWLGISLVVVGLVLPAFAQNRSVTGTRVRTDDGASPAVVLCVWSSGSGTPEASVTGNVCDLYTRTDGASGTVLYVKESGSGNTGWVPQSVGAISVIKSFTFAGAGIALGEHFQAGFYDYSAADANLNQGSLTVTHGGANAPYAAHAFIVSGGDGSTDGSDLVLTVTGTSIDDAGTRTAADSVVIEATAATSATDTYFETAKKWIGTITFTLSSTGGTTFNYDFNYGFAKYEDFGNRDFLVTDFEAVGLPSANDAGFEIELLYHNATGWTYHASAFVAGNTPILSMNTIYSTEQDLDSDQPFAFKRAGLSTAVLASNAEGILVRVTTATNNSIDFMDTHIGVVIQ